MFPFNVIFNLLTTFTENVLIVSASLFLIEVFFHLSRVLSYHTLEILLKKGLTVFRNCLLTVSSCDIQVFKEFLLFSKNEWHNDLSFSNTVSSTSALLFKTLFCSLYSFVIPLVKSYNRIFP